MNLTISKAATTAMGVPAAEDMALINALTLGELEPNDVYIFRVKACNDQVDRDFERFTGASLEKLAQLFEGKPGIFDHKWSAKEQTARIYRAETALREDGGMDLVFHCYMLRNEENQRIIDAIYGGILKEVSVGCAISRAVCNICGREYGTCGHRKGESYDGKLCVCELHDPVDAYEFSFVAVPAQPGAGVTKSHHHSGFTPAEIAAAKDRIAIEHERWK